MRVSWRRCWLVAVELESREPATEETIEDPSRETCENDLLRSVLRPMWRRFWLTKGSRQSRTPKGPRYLVDFFGCLARAIGLFKPIFLSSLRKLFISSECTALTESQRYLTTFSVEVIVPTLNLSSVRRLTSAWPLCCMGFGMLIGRAFVGMVAHRIGAIQMFKITMETSSVVITRSHLSQQQITRHITQMLRTTAHHHAPSVTITRHHAPSRTISQQIILPLLL
jgi:hypothetical protein